MTYAISGPGSPDTWTGPAALFAVPDDAIRAQVHSALDRIDGLDVNDIAAGDITDDLASQVVVTHVTEQMDADLLRAAAKSGATPLVYAPWVTDRLDRRVLTGAGAYAISGTLADLAAEAAALLGLQAPEP